MRRRALECLTAALAALPCDGCVEWTGFRTRDGYASTWNPRRKTTQLAHRVVYEYMVGPVPDDLTIDHLCRNRVCVNPAHLEPVTRAENTRRGEPATKTRCVNGHPYDRANTYYRRGSGQRDCRACGRERVRRYKARTVAA